MHVVDLFFNELPHLRLSRLRSLLASSVLTASAEVHAAAAEWFHMLQDHSAGSDVR